MIKGKTFIFLILFCVTQIHSQKPSYFHYTSSDGLASSTVYDILQDKDGFMWFATANGLSKFDGTRFKNFQTKDGLNSNSIISIAQNKNGDLFIGTFEKGINVLKKGKIENYINSKLGNNFMLSYILLDSITNNKQSIIAYTKWHIPNIISPNKKGDLILDIINSIPLAINKLEKLPNGKLIALTETGLYNYKSGVFSKSNVVGLPETDIFSISSNQDSSFIIGTKNAIYKIKNNKVVKKYTIDIAGNNEVMAVLIDRNQNIWFSIMNKGFYMIPNNTDKIINIGEKFGLQNTLVNKYLEDKESNIWVSTFGKGVICIHNSYINSYTENDGLSSNNVFSIEKDKYGKLLFGTFSGITILENDTLTFLKKKSSTYIKDYIYSIKNIDNEFYVCSALGRGETINTFYKDLKFHILNTLSFAKLKNGLYLFGYRSNEIYIENSLQVEKNQINKFSIYDNEFNNNRINQIFEDTKENVWIGTGLGLCKASIYKNKTGKIEIKKTFFPTNSVLNAKINNIIQTDKNNIWIAGEKGIAHYNLKNDAIKSYSTIDEYDLSSSTSLAIDHKNRIWIGNMKGLFLFDGNSIKFVDNQTGLPSNEVYALLFESDKNRLVVGSSGGVSFLDVEKFDKQKLPKLDVTISSIKAGDSIYTDFNQLEFNPKQRDITINFKSLYFSSPKYIRYQYQLNDTIWKETDNDFLDFISLKSGVYNLKIKAKSQNKSWGNDTQITFNVKPKFIETIWFNLLILIVVTSLSLSISIWISQEKQYKIRKELNLNERFNALKHQALSAMMNPHFIFNALNSVQYLINCNRNEEANDYIAMMAKLIRKNLITAADKFILLSEEIERLELYLNIEKLRLQEGFTYQIIIDSDVDVNKIQIPNMIIQPFVENTLWHGIVNSGNNGIVTISFSFENIEIDTIISRSLIIKITDNGIGIIEAKKYQKVNHISKGINIIEERLQLLSEKMEIPQPIMFEDLSNRDKNIHGTEVIISLPFPLYQVIAP
jgi:ligand-binding sensor domain-containing protein